MKSKLLFTTLLFSILLFQSCKKEDVDPNANLTGAYTLTTVKVDGVASTGSGKITFVATDKTGNLDIKYRIDSGEHSLKGDFIFTATSALLSLNPGTASEIKWTRTVDKAKEQSIEFTQLDNGKNRVVALTFTK